MRKIKKIHLNRLKKLADHLLSGQLGHDKFDFSKISERRTCGTAGCAMGELPILFPDNFKFSEYQAGQFKNWGARIVVNSQELEDVKELSNLNTYRDVEDFFGLQFFERSHLFMPLEQEEHLPGTMLEEDATKEQVAEQIILFIKYKCDLLNIPYESINAEEV